MFKECDTCSAKPGSPVLCSGCLHNRSIQYNIEKEIIKIRGNLTESFPELAYIGKEYTIKMLDNDLKRVLSLIG